VIKNTISFITVDQDSSNRKIITRILIAVALILPVSIIGGAILYKNSQPPTDIDVFAPGNNCCNEPDYRTCTTNQQWVNGYNACTNKQCNKCKGTSGSCNNNTRCQAGENQTNCPNDCDAGGFSQQAAGTICSPANADAGRDDCDSTKNLRCLTCASGTNKSGNSFCGNSAMVNSGAFASNYCGGSVVVPPPSSPTPNNPPPVTDLPDTGIAETSLGLVTGVVLLLLGINLYKNRRNRD
jgi:hypothetical protein